MKMMTVGVQHKEGMKITSQEVQLCRVTHRAVKEESKYETKFVVCSSFIFSRQPEKHELLEITLIETIDGTGDFNMKEARFSRLVELYPS